MKSGMGLSKGKGKGHVLGSTKDGKQIDERLTKQETSQMYEYFDIDCADENVGKLGLTIPYDNMVVRSVDAKGPAEVQGVRKGDVVIALDDNPINSLADFTMLMGALDRPFKITFGRPKDPTESSDSGKLIPDMGIMKAINGASTSGTSGKRPTAAPALSDAQKEERREAMEKAAAKREGAWASKVKSSSLKNRDRDTKRGDLQSRDDRPTFDHSEAASHQNAETARMVAAAKAGEDRTACAMGYSPFAATSSAGFAASTSLGISTGTSDASPRGPRTQAPEGGGGDLLRFDEVQEDHVSGEHAAQVDAAFEMMFASNMGEEAVLACLTTIGKVLGNVVDQPLEDKFRKIKLGNKAVRERILSVAGGVEVLVAAGFAHADGDEGEGDILVHAKSGENQVRVTFVNQRVQELL